MEGALPRDVGAFEFTVISVDVGVGVADLARSSSSSARRAPVATSPIRAEARCAPSTNRGEVGALRDGWGHQRNLTHIDVRDAATSAPSA